MPPSKRPLFETPSVPALLNTQLVKINVVAGEGLRSKAFWSHEDLPWMADFEKGFDDVRKELLALRGRGGFQVLTISVRFLKQNKTQESSSCYWTSMLLGAKNANKTESSS